MNREPDPWRGLDPWADMAAADAERDYAASLTAIADREYEQAHRIAYAAATDEARQSRIDRWTNGASWLVLIALTLCSTAAWIYCGWTLLAAA